MVMLKRVNVLHTSFPIEQCLSVVVITAVYCYLSLNGDVEEGKCFTYFIPESSVIV